MAGLQDGSQTTNALGERIYETIATCKHFVGYSVDEMPPRLSFDPNVSNTDLWQYFFPAWEACAKSAVSVMCAYLLRDIVFISTIICLCASLRVCLCVSLCCRSRFFVPEQVQRNQRISDVHVAYDR